MHSINWPDIQANLLFGSMASFGSALPVLPCRQLKIFVIANDEDMLVEQQMLEERLLPRLRQHLQPMNIDCQIVFLEQVAVELTEPTLKKSFLQADVFVSDLIASELKQCAEDSLATAFVVLLGEKFGPLTVPERIESNLFRLLLKNLVLKRGHDAKDAALLEQVYREDASADPAQMILSYAALQHAKAITGKSAQVSAERLQQLIDTSLQRCFEQMTVDSKVGQNFLTSELADICRRAVSFTTFPEHNTIVIQRRFKDMLNHLAEANMDKYVDLVGVGNDAKLNSALQAKLDELIHATFGLVTCKADFNVLWRQSGIDPTWRRHADYLQQLEDFTFDSCLKQLNQRLANPTCPAATVMSDHFRYDGLLSIEDVYDTWVHATNLTSDFAVLDSHRPILNTIYLYIVGEGSGQKESEFSGNMAIYNLELNKPLTVVGLSNSGKSSLAAYVAVMTSRWLQKESGSEQTDQKSPICCLRFCTQVTGAQKLGLGSGFELLLMSICRQLQWLFSQDFQPGTNDALEGEFPEELFPNDTSDAVACFQAILEFLGQHHRKFIFILDGLDLLQTAGNDVCNLSWLPEHLAPNVKLICTYNIGEGSEPARANTLIMPLLTADDGMDITEHCLTKSKRKLTETQLGVVRQTLQASLQLTPLYCRLVVEQAATWVSSMDPGLLEYVVAPPSNAAQMVSQRLDRCEELCGELVTSHVLSFLALSAAGLTESQLEDMTLLDNALVAYWHELHPNSHVRLAPQRCWFFIKHLLGSILVKRRVSGFPVYMLRSPLCYQVVCSRYLNQSCVYEAFHSKLCDYYLETRSTYRTVSQRLMFRRDPTERLMHLSSHSTHAKTQNGIYNRLKLLNLPYHLKEAGRIGELLEECLVNYEWLYAKTVALGLSYTLEDIQLQMQQNKELQMLHDALQNASVTISCEDGPQLLSLELSSRLLPYVGIYPQLTRLVEHCDQRGINDNLVSPLSPYPHVPGAAWSHSIVSEEDMDYVKLLPSNQGTLLMTKLDKGNTIYFHSVLRGSAEGESNRKIYTSVGEPFISKQGQLIVVDWKKATIKFHDRTTGRFLGQILPLADLRKANNNNENQTRPISATDIRCKPLLKMLCFGRQLCLILSMSMDYLIVYEATKRIHEKGSSTESNRTNDGIAVRRSECLPLPGRCTVCVASDSEDFLFCNGGTQLGIYKLISDALQENVVVELLLTINLQFLPKQILVARNMTQLFVLDCLKPVIPILRLEMNVEVQTAAPELGQKAASFPGGMGSKRQLGSAERQPVCTQAVIDVALLQQPSSAPSTKNAANSPVVDILLSQTETYLLVRTADNLHLFSRPSGQLTQYVGTLTIPESIHDNYRQLMSKKQRIRSQKCLYSANSHYGRTFSGCNAACMGQSDVGVVLDSLGFENAAFIRSDTYLLATAFRYIFVWQLPTLKLMSTLKAPLGSIDQLLVPASSKVDDYNSLGNDTCAASLFLARSLDSNIIDFWNADNILICPGDHLDIISKPVQRLALSQDCNVAAVAYCACEKLAIFNVRTGEFSSVLIHEASVLDFYLTTDGRFVVSLEDGQKNKQDLYKIWNLSNGSIIFSFDRFDNGINAAHFLSFATEFPISTQICYLGPNEPGFKRPNYLCQFSLLHNSSADIEQVTCDFALNGLIGTPFLLASNRFLVALNAEVYDEMAQEFDNIRIFVFDLQNNFHTSIFGLDELCDFVNCQLILDVRSFGQHPYTILVFFAHRSDSHSVTDSAPKSSVGYLLLDICTKAVVAINDLYLNEISALNVTALKNIYVAEAKSWLLDMAQLKVTDISTGAEVKVFRLTSSTGDLPHRAEDETELATLQLLRQAGYSFVGFALGDKLMLWHSESVLVAICVATGRALVKIRLPAAVGNCAIGPDKATLAIGLRNGIFLSYRLIDFEYDQGHIRLLDSSLPSRGSNNYSARLRQSSPTKIDRPISAQNCIKVVSPLSPTDDIRSLVDVHTARPHSDTC